VGKGFNARMRAVEIIDEHRSGSDGRVARSRRDADKRTDERHNVPHAQEVHALNSERLMLKGQESESLSLVETLTTMSQQVPSPMKEDVELQLADAQSELADVRTEIAVFRTAIQQKREALDIERKWLLREKAAGPEVIKALKMLVLLRPDGKQAVEARIADVSSQLAAVRINIKIAASAAAIQESLSM
jgi:hypothetical protein